jgi:hypothetical protein
MILEKRNKYQTIEFEHSKVCAKFELALINRSKNI